MFGALNRLGSITRAVQEVVYVLFKPSGADSLITADPGGLTFKVRG